LKVTLIVAGILFVMFVGLVLAGVYAVRTYGPGLVETGQQGVEQGEAFGRGTDEKGCVAESLARHESAKGFGEMIKANVFLRSCLEASRPTAGFCDDVPGRLEFIKSAQWQSDQCKGHGFENSTPCKQVFQQVQKFCEQHRMFDKTPPPSAR
jgi:hypothetical protein